jgi:hypothetical protein
MKNHESVKRKRAVYRAYVGQAARRLSVKEMMNSL